MAKSIKVASSKGKAGATASAKGLKHLASQLAYEGSPARYLGIAKGNKSLRLSQLVGRGLPTRSAAYLADKLDVPASEFTAHYVHIPKQTMARRKHAGKFTVEESDRVARFARLLKNTTDMMEGDHDAAIHWLKSPQLLLEDQTPLEYARTETGASEVQQLIGRIEVGAYS